LRNDPISLSVGSSVGYYYTSPGIPLCASWRPEVVIFVFFVATDVVIFVFIVATDVVIFVRFVAA